MYIYIYEEDCDDDPTRMDAHMLKLATASQIGSSPLRWIASGAPPPSPPPPPPPPSSSPSPRKHRTDFSDGLIVAFFSPPQKVFTNQLLSQRTGSPARSALPAGAHARRQRDSSGAAVTTNRTDTTDGVLTQIPFRPCDGRARGVRHTSNRQPRKPFEPMTGLFDRIISYQEFKSSLIRKLYKEDTIKQMFDDLDVDNDSTLSITELAYSGA